MLEFGNFLYFPAIYKGRVSAVNNNTIYGRIRHFYDKNEKKFVFIGNVRSLKSGKVYQVRVELYESTFNISTPCKVGCPCESFKYEFSYSLFKHNAVCKGYSMSDKPSSKNEFSIPSGCKHIIFFCQYLNKNRKIYQNLIETEIKKAIDTKLKEE